MSHAFDGLERILNQFRKGDNFAKRMAIEEVLDLKLAHPQIIEVLKLIAVQDQDREISQMAQKALGEFGYTLTATENTFIWTANEVNRSVISKQTDNRSQFEGNIFCSKCGTQLPLDAKFCMKCGKEVQLIMSQSSLGAPVKEVDQGQLACPKCGGYKLSYPTTSCLEVLYVPLLMVSGLGSLLGLALLFFDDSRAIGLLLLVAGGIVIFALFQDNRTHIQVRCKICGYTWEQVRQASN